MTIDDWFADRQNGSLGDAPDDEVVEFTAVTELPPEFPDEALAARPSDDGLDALRRRNGLPARLRTRTAQPRTRPAPPPRAAPEVPWHLRGRILDAARLLRGAGPREIEAEVRLRGADVTRAQVLAVLGTLSPAERTHVYGAQTAVQREAREVPRRLGRPAPAPTMSPQPQPLPRRVPRSIRPPETCPACGLPPGDRGLCACS